MATIVPKELINSDQRRSLDEQGFFITEVLFDELTLEAVRHEFLRIWQQHIEKAKEADSVSQRLAETRPFLPRLHEVSPVCDAFCRHQVFLQLCRELLGPDADTTWNQAILKPPSTSDNAFAWHQDNWYALNGEYANDSNLDALKSPDNSFTAWVAISRTTVDNGTLWVLPGRHKEGLLPHNWDDTRREWVGQFDTSWRIPAVMQAGQILIFRKHTPHGSGANVSEETRMAYQIGYSVPGLKLGPSRDIVPVMRDGQPLRP